MEEQLSPMSKSITSPLAGVWCTARVCEVWDVHALTSSCFCNLIGMVAALGLHQPANRGKDNDRVTKIWTRGKGRVQYERGSGRSRCHGG